MAPPKTELNQTTIPFVPTYETATPQKYTYFQTHDSIGKFYRRGEEIDLTLLRAELFKIKSGEQVVDQMIAGEVLDKLAYYYYEHSKVPKTLTEFREMIGEENYLALNVIFTLRNEECFFDSVLDGIVSPRDEVTKFLSNSLEKFGLDPSNAESLEDLFSDIEKTIFIKRGEYKAGTLKERFELLFIKAANRAVAENNLEGAVKLLSDITYYRKGDLLYRLSAKFSPSVNISDPNYFITPPKTGRAFLLTRTGSNLFLGLRQFLFNDVGGHHDSFEMVLNDTGKNGFFKINIPQTINIKEGETLIFENVIETNIVGAQFRDNIKLTIPEGADDKIFSAKYDPEKNILVVKASMNTTDHEQYLVSIDLGMEITNTDFSFHSSYKTQGLAHSNILIENDNEAPIVIVEGPDAVEDGGLFCMNVKGVRDPEGDPIKYPLKWSQTSGPDATLTRTSETRVCAQATPTHKIERPFSFKVTAEDEIDEQQYPLIYARSASKYVTVFNVPRLEISDGDFVKLPPEAIKILTDPEKKDTAAVGFATEQSLYILLRLPTDIFSFSTKLSAEIANILNVDGCEGKLQQREWFGMKKMPGDLFVYQARSPVAKWTKPGTYYFDQHAYVDLEDLRNPVWVEVPITGVATIQDTNSRVKIAVGEIEELDDTHLRIPFVIKNANDTNGQVIKYPEELTVKLENTFRTNSGQVKMTKTVVAKRVEGSESDVAYNIDFAMLPEYRAQDSTIDFSVAVEDVEGKQAQLNVAKSVPAKYNNQTLFDSIRIKVPEETMPFPWFQLNVVAAVSPRLLEVLRLGSHYFRFVPPPMLKNLVDMVELEGNSTLARYNKNKTGLLVPLRIMNMYQQNVARSFVGAGGSLLGRSSFKLPDDLEHPRDGYWDAVVEWETSLEVAGIPGYPNGDEILKKREQPKEPIKVADKKKEPRDDDGDELLGDLGLFLRNNAKINSVESKVKAGEKFHIEVTVPELENRFSLNEIYMPYSSASDVLRIRLLNKKKDTPEEYVVGAVKMRATGKDKVVFEFEIPEFLPDGEYQVEVHLREEITANYTIYYKKDRELLDKNFDVTAIKSKSWFVINATISGSTKNDTNGKGGVIGDQKRK